MLLRQTLWTEEKTRQKKYQKDGENYTMMSFIICIPYKML